MLRRFTRVFSRLYQEQKVWRGCLIRSLCMERVVVRCVPEESSMTICFNLNGSERRMQRDQTEPLGRVLARIANNAVKSCRPKRKKASEQVEEPPQVKLYHGGVPVPDDVTNTDAWCHGAVLRVGSREYSVERNVPTLLCAELPRALLSGFPVCPVLSVEFGHARHSRVTWYREAGEGGGWAEAGRDRVFTPGAAEVGVRLKMRCVPSDGLRLGTPEERVSECPVQHPPGTCTFDSRHTHTRKTPGPGALRVLSYNILADVYAQTEVAREVLYPYCAPQALALPYRQALVQKELRGYRADLLCLQEVDTGVFAGGLYAALEPDGLAGVFTLKERQHEGLATFFRQDKLRLLERHDVKLAEALATHPEHAELLGKLAHHPELRERVMKRSTVLQVTVLESVENPPRKLCVANTHLYWHPKGADVRLIQMAVALRHLQRVTFDLHPGASLLFAGDLNSMPSSGLLQLLIGGELPECHNDWSPEGRKGTFRSTLHCPYGLLSACGEPRYTNYVGGFSGCLDYILVERRALRVDAVIPMPEHQEVIAHLALPSVAHPSDHIALVCDLSWI